MIQGGEDIRMAKRYLGQLEIGGQALQTRQGGKEKCGQSQAIKKNGAFHLV